MSRPLSSADARQSLTSHAIARGEEIRAKYGPRIGWTEILQILADRDCVRYPCEVVFDAAPLQPGEFAYLSAKGVKPEDGFTIYVHPRFATRPDRVPFLVLCQLVRVNYGEFASSADAEAFGAAALGLSQDDYYQVLCAMADEITALGGGGQP
jgi:hypothetical protein